MSEHIIHVNMAPKSRRRLVWSSPAESDIQRLVKRKVLVLASAFNTPKPPKGGFKIMTGNRIRSYRGNSIIKFHTSLLF